MQQTIVNKMELISGLWSEGWQSYNDLFAHSEIFISLMHICNHGLKGLVILYHSLGKFTVEYFHVKVVHGKIFSSLGISNENF